MYLVKKYIKSRILNNYKEIPKEWLVCIQNHVKVLVPKGAKEIYLTGSRVNGTYRDENTNPDFIKHMKQFGKNGYSDWDYITVPHIEYHKNGIDVISQTRNKKIKVYPIN